MALWKEEEAKWSTLTWQAHSCSTYKAFRIAKTNRENWGHCKIIANSYQKHGQNRNCTNDIWDLHSMIYDLV